MPAKKTKALAKPEPLFSRIKHPQKRALLAAYAQNGTLTQAAAAAKCNRGMHHYWMQRDPQYAEAYAEAKEMFGDLLESIAIRRATVGVARKKFHQGKPIIDTDGSHYIEREYSDTLLIFTLKKFRPEYRESMQQMGAPTATIQININRIDPATFVKSTAIDQPDNGNGHHLPAPGETD